MKTMTVQELDAKRKSGDTFQLIDVRESHEVDVCTIDGLHIPMGEVMDRSDEIQKDIPVIVHCRSGARSSAVITALENNLGYTNLINLEGGILAWASEIDPSLDVY